MGCPKDKKRFEGEGQHRDMRGLNGAEKEKGWAITKKTGRFEKEKSNRSKETA